MRPKMHRLNADNVATATAMADAWVADPQFAKFGDEAARGLIEVEQTAKVVDDTVA